MTRHKNPSPSNDISEESPNSIFRVRGSSATWQTTRHHASDEEVFVQSSESARLLKPSLVGLKYHTDTVSQKTILIIDLTLVAYVCFVA
jgi:hypothetical protein